MKTIKIEKVNVIGIYNLLGSIKAKGRKSRALTKFGKILADRIVELQEEEKALLAEYFEVDAQGDSQKDKDGKSIPLEGVDPEEYPKEKAAWLKEELVVDLTEYQPYTEHLLAALEDWEEPISGVDALMYDELLDALESMEEETAE